MSSYRLIGAFLAVMCGGGMIYVALTLRNTRQYGCYCVALFCLGSFVGNVQRISEPPTIASWIGYLALFYGLIYIAKVVTDPAWAGRKDKA